MTEALVNISDLTIHISTKITVVCEIVSMMIATECLEDRPFLDVILDTKYCRMTGQERRQSAKPDLSYKIMYARKDRRDSYVEGGGSDKEEEPHDIPWIRAVTGNEEDHVEDDEDIGVIALLRLKEIRCHNCGVSETVQWRRGWNSHPLCNPCGLRYQKSQYCCYCNYVYTRQELNSERGLWSVCQICGRASHVACMLRTETEISRTCIRCRTNDWE